MPGTSSLPTDIVDATFDRPEGWLELPLPGDGDPRWAETLVASLEAGEAAPELVAQLNEVRRVLEIEDPTGSTAGWVFVPAPELGTISAVMTWGPLWMEQGDSPESWLAGAEAHADDRTEGYEIRGFTSWRRAHPAGEALGFAHLMITGTEEGTESLIEERVVFGIFPPGVRQMIQVVFRSAFMGAFGDMVAETGAIVETLRVELGSLA